ncbi:hypothetical protein [Parendozoicomonas sp. Alg238-R29]|uniref:hypothetical protein n=1 Tax=Parendozoicomonas sp. Alg238-R29 TaxID=2993446 RepID=UPI00248D3C7C|nr:hypothetical protein [Parendozoicomonas sp. Alg238-R29]
MKQHHYMFDSLDDLQRACCDLEDIGVAHESLHVVHKNRASVEKRYLNGVGELEETDLIHTGLRGFLFGVIASTFSGLLTWNWFGTHELGGVITGFVCFVTLGFFTWVGGLVGINHDNWRLSPYHDMLDHGKGLLLVDLWPQQEMEVTRLMAALHREGRHIGECSSLESPFEGGWHLHLHKFRGVA